MWNEPSKERLSKIPKLYTTEDVPLLDKLVHLHFFIADCDWYIAEYDGNDLLWGYRSTLQFMPAVTPTVHTFIRKLKI